MVYNEQDGRCYTPQLLKMSDQEMSSPSSSSGGSGSGGGIEDLRQEQVRLATFERNNWPPNAKMEPRKIAKAGLYYTGQYQEAKCPWCQRVITTWEYGDQAIAKHRNLTPDCPFVLGTSDNVPLLRMTPSPQPSPAPSRRSTESRASDTVDMGGSSVSNASVESQEFLSEASRLRTFEGRWPLSFLHPADLANAGFIYTGQDDIVQCVFCREFLGKWDEDDFPHTEHRSLYPNCPFVRGYEVGNIPIRTNYNPFSLPSASGTVQDMGVDVAGCKDEGPTTSTSSNLKLVKLDGSSTSGVIAHSGPATPKYCTVESRLRTFQSWPPSVKQRPSELAEAGFFHIGIADQVKCYYCDGGLMDWALEDDPWTEHARWFSGCGFLRLIKGDDFIVASIEAKPPEPVPGLPKVDPIVAIQVEEDQLRNMMGSPLVNQVVAMGIDVSHIEAALKKKLASSGCGFKSAQELAEAAMKEAPSSSSADEIPDEKMEAQPASEIKDSEKPKMEVEKLDVEPEKPDVKTPPVEGSEELRSENRKLKEQRMCKVCFDNESNVAFVPCGHLICCVKCAPSLKDCPYCRQPIKGTLKTYMS